ncbi:hypothetical protein D3C76_1257730 [compost metagenome]
MSGYDSMGGGATLRFLFDVELDCWLNARHASPHMISPQAHPSAAFKKPLMGEPEARNTPAYFQISFTLHLKQCYPGDV